MKVWDETIDIAVIGSGFAGLSAAIEAQKSGKTVVIFEKMKAVGGNSIISDGGIAAAGTSLQNKYHIDDSPDQMYEDMLDAGLGLNNPELLRVVVDHAKEAFEWTCDLGVQYLDRVDRFSGHSIPRCYLPRNISGGSIIKRQLEKAQELGVEIRLKTYLDRFICGSDKNVEGIVIRENYDYKNPEAGKKKSIKIKKGVILASGGFSSDVAFRRLQDPRLTEDIDTTNKPFATADTLKQALKIGAMPVQLSHIQLAPWTSPDEKGFGDAPEFAEYILFQYGIIVNPMTGKRFVNELADRKTLSDQILTIGHPCVGIADQTAVKKSGWSIDRCLKKGVVKKFNTLDEFIHFYKIPREPMRETIEIFNHCVIDGEDSCFAKEILETAEQIKTPPYYGVRLWPKTHYTMGGLGINTNAEVIDYQGDPIKGLYAAGEVTGGIHGASRLANCAITDCLVFGRIAGRNAAK